MQSLLNPLMTSPEYSRAGVNGKCMLEQNQIVFNGLHTFTYIDEHHWWIINVLMIHVCTDLYKKKKKKKKKKKIIFCVEMNLTELNILMCRWYGQRERERRKNDCSLCLVKWLWTLNSCIFMCCNCCKTFCNLKPMDSFATWRNEN